MIRFLDCTEAYWLDASGNRGPFAFIDTVTDDFVEVNGTRLFDDLAHLSTSWR